MAGLNPSQKDWLKKEVLRWSDKGIISEYQVDDILKEYNIQFKPKKEEKPLNVVKVLALIGSILLGLGVILFVAANWQEIPRLIKTLMLLTATFGAFYIGYFLSYQKKEHITLGNALIFLSTLFYGGSTFLIAQMYNVNADSHWLVLFWAASIFPVAYFLESLPTYLLTSLLFIIWDGLFNSTLDKPNYYYPLVMFLILLPLSKGKEWVLYLNIFGLVIAQSYAVINQYYWLVLLWSLITLAYYFIYKKNIYSILSSLLFILWNVVYYLKFEDKLPYFYLIPLAFFLFLSYKNKLTSEFVISILGAWVWANLFLGRYVIVILNKEAELIHFLLLQLSIGILFYGIGKFHEIFKGYNLFASIYQLIAILPISILTYIFSFKVVHEEVVPDLSKLFPTASLIFIGIAVLLLIISYSKGVIKQLISKCGAAVIALSIISTLILVFKPEEVVFNTVMFNVTIFLLALISIWYGFEANNVIFFNSGIFIFIVLIISRYFDIFWELLDRSVFFIVGGLVLLVGSVLLEKKRRKTIEQMKKRK